MNSGPLCLWQCLGKTPFPYISLYCTQDQESTQRNVNFHKGAFGQTPYCVYLKGKQVNERKVTHERWRLFIIKSEGPASKLKNNQELLSFIKRVPRR